MKVIYIRESLLTSILSDLFTFSCLGGLWYLNHRFCGGAFLIDLFVGIFVIIGACNSGKKKYYPREAIEVLNLLLKEEGEK